MHKFKIQEWGFNIQYFYANYQENKTYYLTFFYDDYEDQNIKKQFVFVMRDNKVFKSEDFYF